jgi:hypothetical protein
MQVAPPNCFKRGCKHYDNVAWLGEMKFIHVCIAFPKGIPEDIAYGNNEHLEVVEGQTGTVVFEKE